MIFYFGIGFMIVGIVMVVTQLDFHTTTTLDTPSDTIIPKLQLTPTNIRNDDIAVTSITMNVLNYSDYVAKNISVDIKFGDSLWKKELRKASSLYNYDMLFAGENDSERLDMLKNFLNLPLIPELKPKKIVKIGMNDTNKDWVLKQEIFLMKDGKSTPIKPEESMQYQESQGWKEQIENAESGEPIQISLRMVWENEIGRVFDQTDEYQLICTKIGTSRSYTFLPIEKTTADQ